MWTLPLWSGNILRSEVSYQRWENKQHQYHHHQPLIIIMMSHRGNFCVKDEEIDVVGDDGSESSFASHRKKLSAFTIESILSGMADIKDEDSLSETNLNTSFEECVERDFARSPSPTTSTASSPPTSPHMSAVMAHHIRQYQVAIKDNDLSINWRRKVSNLTDISLRHLSSSSQVSSQEALQGWAMFPMWATSWRASSSRNQWSIIWRTTNPCLKPTRRRRRGRWRRTAWSRWPSRTFRYSGPYLSSPLTTSPSTSGRSWEPRQAAWSITAWWRTLPAWCQPRPSSILPLATAWISITLKAFCLTLIHPLDFTTLVFLRGGDEIKYHSWGWTNPPIQADIAGKPGENETRGEQYKTADWVPDRLG